MFTRLRTTSLVVLASFCAPLAAQTPITMREVIEPAPPFSICIDGATHVGTCTGMRYKPDASVGSLVPFEGQPVELSGTYVRVTCTTMTVSSVTPLRRTLSSTTTNNGANLQLDVFGVGSNTDTFFLFVAAAAPTVPIVLPGIGPFHLDLVTASFIGGFSPMGANTPMFQTTIPTSPILLGVPVFQQALVSTGGTSGETSNVDCFQF